MVPDLFGARNAVPDRLRAAAPDPAVELASTRDADLDPSHWERELAIVLIDIARNPKGQDSRAADSGEQG
jgi:hypothetical protein